MENLIGDLMITNSEFNVSESNSGAEDLNRNFSSDHRPIGSVLSRLKRIQKTKSGYLALCPAHNDKERSLSISEGEDWRILLKCFAGCSVEEIVRSIGLKMSDLFPKEQAEERDGLTLSQYAEYKKLPIDFLQKLGLSDSSYQGINAVRIPYCDEGNHEVATRFRRALQKNHSDDNRFRWKLGSKLCLYGLNKKFDNNFRILVEGESDCQTLWFHDFPALGIPGACNWDEGRDAKFFDDCNTVFVFIESDKGGETVKNWLAISRIKNKVKLVTLNKFKDPSDLYLHDPEHFKENFLKALEQAISWRESRDYSGPSTQREKSTWPSPLAKEAFHGLAGDFVKMVEPQTEADPVALLVQLLTATGNVIGSNPFFQVEADKHHIKIFPVLVGETSKGRKGTSTGYMRHTFGEIDPEWTQNRIKSGLSSGEGLIWQVRDEIRRTEPIREKGRVTDYQEIIADPGVKDKRLLIIEPEFASTLRVIGRDGNTLSPTIRQTWDSGDLRVLTKNSPAVATGAHISIIAHISRDELKHYLDRTEIGNGFANRFIFLCVRRSKTLPEGAGLYGLNLESIQKRFKEAIEFGKTVGEIRRDGRAMVIWSNVYPELSAGKPGLLGAVISRAEAQVMRISCIYALLDKSIFVRAEHLLAALALWDYSEASARYIFGDATGDFIADRILQALRGSSNGLTRTEIRDLFFRHVSGEKIDEALLFLESHGLLRMAKEITGGRPIERWVGM